MVRAADIEGSDTDLIRLKASRRQRRRVFAEVRLIYLFLTVIAVLTPNLSYAARNMTVEDYFTKSRAGKSPAYFLVEKASRTDQGCGFLWL